MRSDRLLGLANGILGESVLGGLRCCGEHRHAMRGMESMPVPLRHDDHHSSPHLERPRPIGSDNGESRVPVQDVHELVAIRMALPRTLSGEAPAEDTAPRKGANMANAALASASVVSLPRPCRNGTRASSSLMSTARIISSVPSNCSREA